MIIEEKRKRRKELKKLR